MSLSTTDAAAKVFVDPQAYADEPRLHATFAHRQPTNPFWAITKYRATSWRLSAPMMSSRTHRLRHGVHFDLGAAGARLESIELTSPVECMATTFVGGIKHLPIRYRLSSA
jgi:hypothetical protein